MRTFVLSWLVAALAVLGVQPRAAATAPLTVVLRASPDTRYADVARVIRNLALAQVATVELQVAEPGAAGVSAVLRASGDTPYRDVVETLRVLQCAGVRQVE